MKRLSLFLSLFTLILSSCSDVSDQYVLLEGFAQGGTYHVILSLPEGWDREYAQKRVDTLLLEIDNSLSGYNKGSLLSRLNSGEDLPLDNHFIKVFNRSKEIWEESGGAFDPSSSALFDLWGFGFSNKEKVTQAALDSILTFTGMDKLSLEEKEDGIHLVRKDIRIKLNFNAIAQGYTVDAVAAMLSEAGCGNYLVEVGREIVCKGKSSRGGDWRVGLDKPTDGNMDEGKNLQEIISLTDKGIVTSGNYRKFYIEDGEKYAHTIDPSTGRPVRHNLLSATVIAKDGTTADAYATWCMVVGPEKARAIALDRNDIEMYLIYGEQDSMSVWKSDGITLDNNN